MTHQPPVICVDGPSGSGKGTLSIMLAQRLGYHRLDSGALYRLVGLAARRLERDLEDGEDLGQLARELDISFRASEDYVEEVLLDGESVADEIRTEETAAAASKVAQHSQVRAALLEVQRNFAQEPGLVADGRDMGTVVFPDAPVKIFLTASAEERARRRHKQLKEKGVSATFRALLGEIRLRDERDQTRAVAPLTPADDAVILDTTGTPVEEVCQKVLSIIQERLSR